MVQPGGSEPFGVAVASQTASSKFAFNAPQASGGVNTIYVKERGPIHFADHCSVSVPMADLAVTAAQSLAHLDSAFDAFVGGGSGIAFGTYRSETSTGGSVGLFGPFVASGCTSVKQVNNCASDSGQKQGQSLTGGSTCIGSAGRKLLIVGAPGYSNNGGRVDIYAEGTQLTSVAPCGAPTATPTPNPTATPTSTPETSAIVDSTPTATPGVGGTPIPVDQNTRDLPAPEVAVNAKTVTITAAILRSKLKGLKLVGYLFEVSSVSTKATLSILEVGAFGTSSKKRQILSKRNRITLRNLQPGTYTVSYRAVLSSKQKKQILGKSSRSTRFAVR